MHQITTDEFRVIQGDCPARLTGFLPSGEKHDLLLIYGQDAAVGNGNLVGISAKVLNGIAKTVESFLYVRTPVFFIKAVAETDPFIRTAQLFTGRRKGQFATLVQGVQFCKVFSFEFIPQDFYRDKEFIPGFPDFVVPGQAAPGNDAVHMHMVTNFLIPGMEDLDNTGCCAKILFIRGQFQKCLCTAPVEQPIEKFLVAVDEAV